MSAPVVAVIPFGARAAEARAGAWARQLGRRLVDRFTGDPRADLRPVFLVAVPAGADDQGYLVFGSTPDQATAASYGRSMGAAFVLAGVYREEVVGRRLELDLVDVATGSAAARFGRAVPADELHLVEPALAAWLVGAIGATPAASDAVPVAASEAAYAALLEAMDAEVDATLLRDSDPKAAGAAISRALGKHLGALRADPACLVAEERLLVLAAESIERGDEEHVVGALEALVELKPRSWRAHYLLAELRATMGELSGAVVAFEHSDALHPLPDEDVLRLAQLYATAGAPQSAIARLRRVKPASVAYAKAQDEVGLLQAQRGDLPAAIAAFERAIAAGAREGATYARLAQCHAAAGDDAAAGEVLRRAGEEATPSWELELARGARAQTAGDARAAIERYRAALALGAPAVLRLDLARVLVAAGDRQAALVELEAMLAAESQGEFVDYARDLAAELREPERLH